MKKIVLGIMVMFICGSVAFAQRGGGRGGGQGRGQGAPQEAIDACSSKSVGDSCSFSGRNGDAVSGTCIEDGDDIACAPEGHGQGEKGR